MAPEFPRVKLHYAEPGLELYLGDCREVVEALGLTPEVVELLWGDPPYGIRTRPTSTAPRLGGAAAGKPGNAHERVHGDDEPFDPRPWLGYRRAVLWGANHYAQHLPPSPSWWCWDKRVGAVPERTQADAELAWTNLGGPVRVFRYLWDGICQAGKEHNNGARVHPTQKPEALAEWGLARAGLQRGDLVFSPWLGSGPEAAAAKRLGLRFVGVDIVPEYLDACADRLRQGVLPLEMR